MRKQGKAVQSLTETDLLAIDGIVGRRLDEFSKLVRDHDITLYGPDRSDGLRSKVAALDQHAMKSDKRWYKLVAIALAAQLIIGALGFYVEHRYIIEEVAPLKNPQISLDNHPQK